MYSTLIAAESFRTPVLLQLEEPCVRKRLKIWASRKMPELQRVLGVGYTDLLASQANRFAQPHPAMWGGKR
jgi:hypothetical protein